MDQYLSAVIIAIITGVFSIITLYMQRKQDKVIEKIDQQTRFLEKEKDLKSKLTTKEKEQKGLIHDIIILILDTNIDLLNGKFTEDAEAVKEVFDKANDIKNKYTEVNDEIDELSKQYALLLEVRAELESTSSSKNAKK